MSDNIQSAIEFENIFYDFWKCENQKREVHVKLQPEIVGQFFKTQLCLFQTLLSLSYQTTTKSFSPDTDTDTDTHLALGVVLSLCLCPVLRPAHILVLSLKISLQIDILHWKLRWGRI